MADLITTEYLTDSIPAMSARSDLAELVSVASVMVEDYCGRVFALGEGLVDYLDGTGTSRIWVLRPPVVAIESVTCDGSDIAEDDGFIADYAIGRLTRGDGRIDPAMAPPWPVGTRNVVVTYDGGYEEIPGPVKMATALVCQGIANASAAPFKSERMDNYSYVRADADSDLPPAAMALLSAYRRIPVGGRG